MGALMGANQLISVTYLDSEGNQHISYDRSKMGIEADTHVDFED